MVTSLSVYVQGLRTKTLYSFPMKGVWRTFVQPKLCFFAWEATWKKVLTFNQL